MADPARPLRIKTPLGDKAFILELFRGNEALSEPFLYQIMMLTEPDTKVEFDKLLGQEVTVMLDLADGTTRYFHGLIKTLTQGHQVRGDPKKKPPIRFLAEIVPQFWFLQRIVQTRMFQRLTVEDILKKVLTGVKNVKYDLQAPDGGWKKREYTVQFRESDFNFVCRLLEDEGIFYYFTHTTDSHTMVVSNKTTTWTDVPLKAKIAFDDVKGGQYDDDVISEWQKIQEVRTAKYRLWDYHFELPDKNLESTKDITPTVSVGTITHKLKVGVNDKFEIYDFPGGYAWRFDRIDPGGADNQGDLTPVTDDGTRTAGIRMDQETARGIIINGKSTCRQMTAGCKFTLDQHFDGNGDYVLVRVEHTAAQMGMSQGGVSTGLGGKVTYENRFRCIPKAVPFRPAILTPKPRVDGAQTALVVGSKAADEIFTDKYGRVKVQFYWDREGKKDAASSCWLRVATLWGGKSFGFIRIPRVGEEVLVDFLEGDPDRPLIVGCVYNDAMMPPYTLPDNKTQSGLKTMSTTKGEVGNFNELRFEDKKGSEEIYFHAEKDFVRIVENNDTLQVGYETQDGKHKSDDGSQTTLIYKDRTTTLETGNETLTVKKGNRTVTIEKGDDKHEVTKGKRDHIIEKDDTYTINSGNRVVTISKGDDTLDVKMGKRTTTIKGDDTLTLKMGNETVNIDMGNFTMTVKLGNIAIKANVGKIAIEALGGIELKSGPSSVKIDPMGITMKGMMIKAKGDLMTEVAGGLMNTFKSDLLTSVKGTIVMIN